MVQCRVLRSEKKHLIKHEIDFFESLTAWGILLRTVGLDVEFSDSELRDTMFSQNNKKSPVIDLPMSDMFKSAYNIISLVLLTLYNNVLHVVNELKHQ